MCNVSILSYYLASSAHSLWAWDLWTRCSLSLIFLNFRYFSCVSCFFRTNHSIEFDAVSEPTQQPPWPFWHHWSGLEFIFNAGTLFWSENHFCCFLQEELAWLFFSFFLPSRSVTVSLRLQRVLCTKKTSEQSKSTQTVCVVALVCSNHHRLK